jgi:hypothetical protein
MFRGERLRRSLENYPQLNINKGAGGITDTRDEVRAPRIDHSKGTVMNIKYQSG